MDCHLQAHLECANQCKVLIKKKNLSISFNKSRRIFMGNQWFSKAADSRRVCSRDVCRVNCNESCENTPQGQRWRPSDLEIVVAIL